MTQLKRILAATDLTASACRTTARAAALAKSCRAEWTLIHVVDRGALDQIRELLLNEEPGAGESLVDRLRVELEEAAATLVSTGCPAPQVEVRSGKALDEIIEQADRMDADLILVGAQGSHPVRSFVLGSTAERIFRRSRRPTLAVRRTQSVGYEKVLVPVDFSRWSRASVELARRIAPQASVVLLHVFNVPFEGKLRIAGVDDDSIETYRSRSRDEALARSFALANDCGLDPLRTTHLAIDGDPARVIVDQAHDRECDLVVMGKHGRGALEELFLGGITKHVLEESGCDVLVSTAAGAAE